MGRALVTIALVAGALLYGVRGAGIAAVACAILFAVYRYGYARGTTEAVEVLAGLAPPSDEQVEAFVEAQRSAAEERTQ